MYLIEMMMVSIDGKKGRMNEARKNLLCFSSFLAQENISIRRTVFEVMVKSMDIFLSDCHHLSQRHEY